MKEKITGIMGAMPEEIEGIIELLDDRQFINIGMRTYYTGKINNIQTVVVFSRWGKVAAATTVSTLIHEFKITDLIFTGVAGAVDPSLKIGDIVVAKRLVQHDMDARPIMAQFEIPLLQMTFFECRDQEIEAACEAVKCLIESEELKGFISSAELAGFNIASPQLYIGDIASGDKFFSLETDKNALKAMLPGILCVEMEGAAVAQVCYEYGIHFMVIRTISDTADERSGVDFPAFIKHISSRYAVEIIRNIYEGLK